jgi:hypothetical protein
MKGIGTRLELLEPFNNVSFLFLEGVMNVVTRAC